jgi:hypothetical protein
MARKHIKLGLSHSDVIDFVFSRNCRPNLRGVHVDLAAAADHRSRAINPQDFYTTDDHKALARALLRRARAWRQEVQGA